MSQYDIYIYMLSNLLTGHGKASQGYFPHHPCTQMSELNASLFDNKWIPDWNIEGSQRSGSIDVMGVSIENWQSLTTHTVPLKRRQKGGDRSGTEHAKKIAAGKRRRLWCCGHFTGNVLRDPGETLATVACHENHRLQSLKAGRTSVWTSELLCLVGQINMICSSRVWGIAHRWRFSQQHYRETWLFHVVSCIAMYECCCNKTAKMRSLTVYPLQACNIYWHSGSFRFT